MVSIILFLAILWNLELEETLVNGGSAYQATWFKALPILSAVQIFYCRIDF